MSDLQKIRLSESLECYTLAGSGAASDAEFLYREIFQSRDYFSSGITVPRDGVVVDCGANIGIFTLFIKTFCPESTVIAIEPMPPVYAALRANIDHHSLSGVHAFQYALGSQPEMAEFSFFPELPAISTRYPEETEALRALMLSDRGTEETARLMVPVPTRVEVRELSQLLRRGLPGLNHIDLVKIDVEGAELEVLNGLDQADWKRIDQFAIEVQGFDSRLERIAGLLRGHGYTITVAEPGLVPKPLGLRMLYARRR